MAIVNSYVELPEGNYYGKIHWSTGIFAGFPSSIASGEVVAIYLVHPQ
jgi:hypothetical protein